MRNRRRSRLLLGGMTVLLALGAGVVWAATVQTHSPAFRRAADEVFNNPDGSMMVVVDRLGNTIYVADGVIAYGKKKKKDPGPGPAPQPPNPAGLCGSDTMVGPCETSEYSQPCKVDGEDGVQWCSQVSCHCLSDSGSYTATAQGGCGACGLVELDTPGETLPAF